MKKQRRLILTLTDDNTIYYIDMNKSFSISNRRVLDKIIQVILIFTNVSYSKISVE